jgi:hypothetical protein
MAEQRKARKPKAKPDVPEQVSVPAAARVREADDAERSLGRAVSLGLPLLAVVGAVVVGLVASLGSALLVLASGALLGCIALLWASVRTLSGDAPLPIDLEALAARRHGVDDLADQKGRVLRALKDLETEHSLGKIDEADYRSFAARYREDAKALMRQMDLEVAPLREEAERLARDYLEKRLIGATDTAGPEAAAEARPTCESCGTSNDPDAAFCKKCGFAMKAAPEGEATAETGHAAK